MNSIPPHKLYGRGMASLTLDGAEFRPNIFRAAIRGHALRIFGGLLPAGVAEREVDQLFGGLGQRERREPVVGLVGMKFVTERLILKPFGQDQYRVETYEVTGQLSWLLTRPLPEEQREALKQLLLRLTQFAMILGGFGKSWRRADHRLFFPEYYQKNKRPYIGCHWEWMANHQRDVQIISPSHVGKFINDRLLPAAKRWLELQGVRLNDEYAREWRESWHRDKVQVWGRMAENQNDSLAIEWLHRPYTQGQSIKASSLTGKLGRIGRLWHRMYRHYQKDSQSNQITSKATGQYIELLTIFPDNSRECQQFLRFLQQQGEFQRVWPG
ncbi:MAG: hypothetical protein NZL92_10765 [Gloeomargarita sp. SKYG116]|nr:hypothetical protein [Gloeomargarita sp. SKYG116]MDW8402163.1 hypothetical protein [Gloeomargarita sp. SKYGB_i_bin116]